MISLINAITPQRCASNIVQPQEQSYGTERGVLVVGFGPFKDDVPLRSQESPATRPNRANRYSRYL